jgi:hypothetical protein
VGSNSRFGLLREFAGKGLIWLVVFTAKRRFGGEIGENSRFDGKNREICPN